MRKNEMITKVSEVSELTRKDVEKVLKAYTEVIQEGLKQDEEVPMIDGGKFVVVERAERVCRNPRNGEQIIVPAHKVPKFKMGKQLKELLK